MKVDKPIVIISRFNIKRRDLSDEVVAYDATCSLGRNPHWLNCYTGLISAMTATSRLFVCLFALCLI